MEPMDNNITDPQIPVKLDNLLLKNLIDHHKEIITSFKNFWNKYNYLTAKQFHLLGNIEHQYSDNSVEWKNNFTDDMKKILTIAVNYYTNKGYFTDIINNYYKIGNDFIPSKRQYEKMCENKYFKRAFERYNAPPKYQIGDIITIRKKSLHRRLIDKCDGEIVGMISAIGSPCFEASGRLYDIMWIGGEQFDRKIFESEIKIYREKNSDS